MDSLYLGVFSCDIDQSCRLLHAATHGSHYVYEDVSLWLDFGLKKLLISNAAMLDPNVSGQQRRC
jgi:hypothetical protein